MPLPFPSKQKNEDRSSPPGTLCHCHGCDPVPSLGDAKPARALDPGARMIDKLMAARLTPAPEQTLVLGQNFKSQLQMAESEG
ncbi:uncharacterized protein BDCG_17284 [Blastomyces dermatitidis ER-3]|uniref:Uncharacterized protein n=3 Tax=Blastomyces TaxID=229219 RepID=A0A179U7Y1_BLAGS|nr:uncharacterized protein BDBG_16174 [Blastomyces gilchristii SLH14081]XP_045277781.1 uncharacterized protein BDCG_17284 [Blastomyces dermatitidis ER-3]EQL32014.1 hypothetical protein BDFG_05736 [Blastomyces dermatitidis ATCC 26199]KMW67833.1 hypothetical protein BDDG_12363 [Blastomyces dermatitidis ATCC 18188]EEQ91203.2 hypothetical protein BDCG_17284 [Blastomyces dermatitidis ER-3]OAT04074.1 hypothetical protein BDBG_16174 [Blastomyces gilchristii SLH14081]